MHYSFLVTFDKAKANTSKEARQYVWNTLQDEGFIGTGRWACGQADWFVIGGRWSRNLTDHTKDGTQLREQIYKMALPFADRIYLTRVFDYSDGDTFFNIEILSLLDGHFDRVDHEDDSSSYNGLEMSCSGFYERGSLDEPPSCEWWILNREKKMRE